MTNVSKVEIISLPAMKFIGVPVTSAFASHDPSRVERARHDFMNRLSAIHNVSNPSEYICLHFNSETLFTYVICMEVAEIADVPEGMIGFTIPAHRYGMTRSDSDPYSDIHQYLQQQGLSHDNKALALEVYQFEDPKWPGKVDVYIPIA